MQMPVVLVSAVVALVFLYALVNPLGAKRMSEHRYYKAAGIPEKPVGFYRILGAAGFAGCLFILWKIMLSH
jgi:hypothetical protein